MADPTDQPEACASCGEGSPTGECPKSQRPCGHHCNHVWEHDECDWCRAKFLPDGEVRWPPCSCGSCALYMEDPPRFGHHHYASCSRWLPYREDRA